MSSRYAICEAKRRRFPRGGSTRAFKLTSVALAFAFAAIAVFCGQRAFATGSIGEAVGPTTPIGQSQCMFPTCNNETGCSSFTNQWTTWYPHGQCYFTGVSVDTCLYGLMKCREDWWYDAEDCTGSITQHTTTDENGC